MHLTPPLITHPPHRLPLSHPTLLVSIISFQLSAPPPQFPPSVSCCYTTPLILTPQSPLPLIPYPSQTYTPHSTSTAHPHSAQSSPLTHTAPLPRIYICHPPPSVSCSASPPLLPHPSVPSHFLRSPPPPPLQQCSMYPCSHWYSVCGVLCPTVCVRHCWVGNTHLCIPYGP